MSVQIGNVEMGEDGVVRFDSRDTEELKSAFKEIFQSELGELYLRDYYLADRDDTDAVVAQAVRKAGSNMVSMIDLALALKALIHANVIPKKVKRVAITEPVEVEEVVDNTPRDKNGRPLSKSQLAWSEMQTFSATASADAIRQRSHTDAAFRSFVQSNLRKEMEATPIGDAVEPAGQSTKTAKASQALRDFALLYQREPSANLRAVNGMVRLGGEQVPLATFNDLLSRAADAKLI